MPVFSFPAQPRLRFRLPNVPEVEAKLIKLDRRFKETEDLALEAMAVAQVDMEERFVEEVDPDGNPWEELVKPAEDQIGILRLTGTMAEEAVSDAAWTATPEGVFFNTEVLPDYWVFHDQPEGAGGQRIPQRKFIGLSADAEAEILGLADMWLLERIEEV